MFFYSRSLLMKLLLPGIPCPSAAAPLQYGDRATSYSKDTKLASSSTYCDSSVTSNNVSSFTHWTSSVSSETVSDCNSNISDFTRMEREVRKLRRVKKEIQKRTRLMALMKDWTSSQNGDSESSSVSRGRNESRDRTGRDAIPQLVYKERGDIARDSESSSSSACGVVSTLPPSARGVDYIRGGGNIVNYSESALSPRKDDYPLDYGAATNAPNSDSYATDVLGKNKLILGGKSYPLSSSSPDMSCSSSPPDDGFVPGLNHADSNTQDVESDLINSNHSFNLDQCTNDKQTHFNFDRTYDKTEADRMLASNLNDKDNVASSNQKFIAPQRQQIITQGHLNEALQHVDANLPNQQSEPTNPEILLVDQEKLCLSYPIEQNYFTLNGASQFKSFFPSAKTKNFELTDSNFPLMTSTVRGSMRHSESRAPPTDEDVTNTVSSDVKTCNDTNIKQTQNILLNDRSDVNDEGVDDNEDNYVSSRAPRNKTRPSDNIRPSLPPSQRNNIPNNEAAVDRASCPKVDIPADSSTQSCFKNISNIPNPINKQDIIQTAGPDGNYILQSQCTNNNITVNKRGISDPTQQDQQQQLHATHRSSTEVPAGVLEGRQASETTEHRTLIKSTREFGQMYPSCSSSGESCSSVAVQTGDSLLASLNTTTNVLHNTSEIITNAPARLFNNNPVRFGQDRLRNIETSRPWLYDQRVTTVNSFRAATEGTEIDISTATDNVPHSVPSLAMINNSSSVNDDVMRLNIHDTYNKPRIDQDNNEAGQRVNKTDIASNIRLGLSNKFQVPISGLDLLNNNSSLKNSFTSVNPRSILTQKIPLVSKGFESHTEKRQQHRQQAREATVSTSSNHSDSSTPLFTPRSQVAEARKKYSRRPVKFDVSSGRNGTKVNSSTASALVTSLAATAPAAPSSGVGTEVSLQVNNSTRKIARRKIARTENCPTLFISLVKSLYIRE